MTWTSFPAIFWPPKEASKCSTAQGPHSEVVTHAFWRPVSKICDECKDSFARGCGAKRWWHWTCSSLGTIFQPMRINSVPDVKCFYNNKNVLCAQSMVWHFVHHPVFPLWALYFWYLFAYILNQNKCFHPYNGLNRKATRKDWRCVWHWRGTEPLHLGTWFPAQHWQWLWRRSVTAGTCQHIWTTWLWKHGLQVRVWCCAWEFRVPFQEFWQWRQQNVKWWKSRG